MATISGPMSGSGDYTLQLTVTTTGWQLRLLRSGSHAASFQNGASWQVTVAGQNYSGSFNFNFAATGSINFLVASGSRATSGTVAVSASVTTATSGVGSGSISGNVNLSGGVSARVSGSWRPAAPWARVGGTWRRVTAVWARTGGVWRRVD